MATEFAVIDIGSNSVRYAEEHDGALSKKEVYTTRLGFGLADTGRLAESNAKKSLEVISKLAERARANGLTPMAYATSAVRDAVNGREFAGLVYKNCGVPVEILSGESEARLAFLGAAGSKGEFDTLLDIGGASAQVVTADSAVSFRAGCVRCSDIVKDVRGDGKHGDFVCKDPSPAPCDIDPLAKRRALRNYLDSEAALAPRDYGRVVGVGGTITTLAALNLKLGEYSESRVNGSRISYIDLSLLCIDLIAMGDTNRRAHPLLRERHDVIICGADILEWFFGKFTDFSIPKDAPDRLGLVSNYEICVSTKDGMEGYLLQLKGN